MQMPRKKTELESLEPGVAGVVSETEGLPKLRLMDAEVPHLQK